MRTLLKLLFPVVFAFPVMAQDTAPEDEVPVEPLDVQVPPPPTPPEDDRIPLDQVQPEPPPLPQKLNPEESLIPEVRIVRTEREIIQEYRINGVLTMVQVTPIDGGPSYYMVDVDGDGQVDTRTSDLETGVRPAMWQIISWD